MTIASFGLFEWMKMGESEWRARIITDKDMTFGQIEQACRRAVDHLIAAQYPHQMRVDWTVNTDPLSTDSHYVYGYLKVDVLGIYIAERDV